MNANNTYRFRSKLDNANYDANSTPDQSLNATVFYGDNTNDLNHNFNEDDIFNNRSRNMSSSTISSYTDDNPYRG